MMPKSTDLTQGGILKKILLVAMPIMGTQLLQMTYNLTDMFWLGRMENAVSAVAASGLGGMFLWLGMALMLFGRVGSEIGVSQNLGAGKPDAAQGYAQDSARIALLLGTLYGVVLLVFAKPLIALLRVQEAAVLIRAAEYLRIVSLGIPFSFLNAAISGGFNGAGNSRLSFLANSAGLAVNMVLDPLMILGWGWGVGGAALATVLAQMVVSVLLVFLAKRHKNRPHAHFHLVGRMSGERVKQIFRWSLPVSLESGAFTALAMVVTGMVSSGFGAGAVAVQRVGTQIESLSWLIGGGFSSAVSAFVGQNLGARKWARIRRGYRISLLSLLIWELLVTLVLFLYGRFLFSLFLSEPPELVDMGDVYLKILSGCLMFAALEGACGGAFRGMGKTLPPSVCSILSNLIRPALCWALALRMGLNGIWLGITLSAALRGLSMFVWYSLSERTLPREDLESAPEAQPA